MRPFGVNKFGGVPDQYYAVTSRLAARGYQQITMRIVATCILTLGLPPALAATNPHSSVWSKGPLTFLIIAVGVIAMSAPWLRYRWPSREVSTTVVMFGSVVLAVGCSLAADPLAGLLIATAFPFILGYSSLFHGTPVQVFVGIAAMTTIAVLATRIAADDVPTALAVATPVVMLNAVIAFGFRMIAGLAATAWGRTDVEPLTGLLTREGFDEMVATLIGARNRDDDRYLVIALSTIDTFAPLQSMQGSRATDRVRIAVAQVLRETVRRDSLLAHVGDAEFMVADTFTSPDATPLAERMRGAVAATPDGVTASIGVVATPLRPLADRPPNEVLEELIALATTAMYRARRRGGDQYDFVIHNAGR
jgi:diguanylate cyclase (GGDEF)-like protein